MKLKKCLAHCIDLIVMGAVREVDYLFGQLNYPDTLGEKTLQVLVAYTAIRLEYGWQTTPISSSRLEGNAASSRTSILIPGAIARIRPALKALETSLPLRLIFP